MSKRYAISLLCALLPAAPALADEPMLLDGLVGSVGVTNNYLWRAVSQTDDGPAISGALDYGYSVSEPLGLYTGLWFSNVDFGGPEDPQYELDLYAGIDGSLYGIGYDLGYIWYAYPDDDTEIDFGEVYLGLGWEWLGLYIYKTTNAESDAQSHNAWYYEGTFDYEVRGVGFNVTVGTYRGSGAETLAGDAYWHYGVHLSKNGFSLGLVDTDRHSNEGQDDAIFLVSWGTEFAL